MSGLCGFFKIIFWITVSSQPQEFPQKNLKLSSLKEGKETPKKETVHSRFVGGSFNKEGNLHMTLLLGGCKMRSPHPSTRILNVYTQGLSEWGHIYRPGVLNALLSQSYVLGAFSIMGMVSGTYIPGQKREWVASDCSGPAGESTGSLTLWMTSSKNEASRLWMDSKVNVLINVLNYKSVLLWPMCYCNRYQNGSRDPGNVFCSFENQVINNKKWTKWTMDKMKFIIKWTKWSHAVGTCQGYYDPFLIMSWFPLLILSFLTSSHQKAHNSDPGMTSDQHLSAFKLWYLSEIERN